MFWIFPHDSPLSELQRSLWVFALSGSAISGNESLFGSVGNWEKKKEEEGKDTR